MKSYDIKCPVCGTINKSLYLEETNGWFICEKCENESQILAYADRVRLPVYTGEELAKSMRPAGPRNSQNYQKRGIVRGQRD